MNRKKALLAVAGACFAVLLAANGSGQDGRASEQPASAPALSDDVLTHITPQRMVAILKKMNVTFEEKTSESGTTFLLLKLADMKAQLLFYGKPDNGYPSIQLHAGFESSKERTPALNSVNEWNRTKRFSRAYIGKDDNSRHLESDLDLEGGVTEKAVGEFVTTFRVSLMRFATD